MYVFYMPQLGVLHLIRFPYIIGNRYLARQEMNYKAIFTALILLTTSACNITDSCDPNIDKSYCQDGVAWNCFSRYSGSHEFHWESISCGERTSGGVLGAFCLIDRNVSDEAFCVENNAQVDACFNRDICNEDKSCELDKIFSCINNECHRCYRGYLAGKQDSAWCCED